MRLTLPFARILEMEANLGSHKSRYSNPVCAHQGADLTYGFVSDQFRRSLSFFSFATNDVG